MKAQVGYSKNTARILRPSLRWFAAALACLLLLPTMTPVAHAQSNSFKESLKGTLCDDPQDENTKSACALAIVQCGLAAGMYGRTEEESGRMVRVCVQKTATQARRAMNAQGDAVRRAYGGETDAQVAADRAAKKKAREKADAAAAAAQTEQQKKWQDGMDAIKQACSTGQGTLIATGIVTIEEPKGKNLSALDSYVYRNQILQPIADPDAPVHGKCTVQFTKGRRTIVGKISILSNVVLN